MINKGIDLPANTISQLAIIFTTYSEIDKVFVFGSRALGNAKPGSDIDLAFSGKKLSSMLVSRIKNHLEEETLMPYHFDCVNLGSTKNSELVEHIYTHGKILYERNS